jgi:hypothetical protein
VPVAEPFRQPAPFAAMLGDIEHRVDDLEIGDPHVAPRHRQQRTDQLILVFGQLHHPMNLPETASLE